MAETRVSLLRAEMDDAFRAVRARLDGLTDSEFLWEPVADSWSVRPVTEPKPPALFESTPTRNSWHVEHGQTGTGSSFPTLPHSPRSPGVLSTWRAAR